MRKLAIAIFTLGALSPGVVPAIPVSQGPASFVGSTTQRSTLVTPRGTRTSTKLPHQDIEPVVGLERIEQRIARNAQIS